MEEQDLLLGLGEGRGTESPAGRHRGSVASPAMVGRL